MVRELRRKLPGIVPSLQAEQKRKHEYNDEFRIILCPSRTPTGWKISPERLAEVLSFQSFWIYGSKYWRVYGDGRETGSRHSCFISLSLVNNELALHNGSYQSPKCIYPVGLFYEGDSRDNLEENLGFPNSWLNKFIEKESTKGDHFFLCGDEMFLEAMLDGKNELSPTSNDGWNIYTKCTKDQKSLTDPTTKRRTDLHPRFDREYPTSILRSIPLENTVFCLLYGLARCVEKLLTLVVQYILLHSNIVNEQGLDGTAYRKEKLHTLETNINKRGVRQGKFIIPFDAGGKLQQIKLNKDHAWVIISPAPAGKEEEFPHVLSDVLPDINHKITIPFNVCMELKIKDQYSETELVSAIWAHFYNMVAMLKKDPPPKPKRENQGPSKNVNDFSWGFTSEEVDGYKAHAEIFYQLFSFRYTARELTPYMIKLVDYGSHFMKNLPVPICRFQAEGGEHTNYEHSTYYYNHTTRHGGNFTLDPMLAIFRNMWRRTCYQISTNTDTAEGRAAAAAFA
ncbi:hypothetical protein HOLleu_03332 [Holothuria leucospilota]|uniref:Uncharacterized protein n=1 Tax=Holothuria leucospilota TaxID=206669 RepID=A0A9Q1HLV0_HOLLE|nr:hypothetical protein HOLleu_03332 [Holothuria leucospilota]